MERSGVRLVWPSFWLTAMAWLHDLDHVRQLRQVEPAVGLLGLIAIILTLGTLGLAIAGHRFASLASIVVGFGSAVGFLAVHVLPDWGPLSDGYPDLPVDAASWVAAILPLLAGVWVGHAGVQAARERRRVDPGS